ncbi:MAG: methyltransferase [Chitinophagaceae bacterium]|nr:methyltransferase [Chitinophagaceae bacterium]
MIKLISKGINFLLGHQLRKKNIFLGNSLINLKRERKIDNNYLDYVRLSALELISYEINRKGLRGNTAELGVYKGKFARYINQYFPDRLLYLFDTFEGFDRRDIDRDIQMQFSAGKQDFSDTSVEGVLKIMPSPEKCVLVKGFFPESAKEIDDDFVFVSIDTDLYDPIYHGLNFFYPKLVDGGYLFVHDFNNDGYRGVRRAVEQFCEELQINFFPLPDSCGSAVIMK